MGDNNVTIENVPIPMTIFTLDRVTRLYDVLPTYMYGESITVYRSAYGVVHGYRGVVSNRIIVEYEVNGAMRFSLG